MKNLILFYEHTNTRTHEHTNTRTHEHTNHQKLSKLQILSDFKPIFDNVYFA
jgi:hypothetical protein